VGCCLARRRRPFICDCASDGRPRDYITQRANVTFDGDARCPKWHRHVTLLSSHRDGTPDPAMYAYLQRWAGYAITGQVDAQRFPFFCGDGNNGKNVFIETLMTLMGTYAIKASAQVLTGSGRKHETIIADLAGARLVFVDETPRGTINEARLKELTGTKRIRARRIQRDSFEFDAKFKFFLSGNNKPRVQDTTDGFWRRLDLIPCEFTIPADERTPDFGKQLEAELPGILNWCLDGYAAYAESGLLPPSRVQAAGKDYRSETATFSQFVADRFDRDGEPTWTPNKVIYALYERWCREQGTKPKDVLTMQQLGDDLRREGFKRCSKTLRVCWDNPGWLGGSAGTTSERGWFGPPPSGLPTDLLFFFNSALVSVDED
jgi:putative DNA primase/helicase